MSLIFAGLAFLGQHGTKAFALSLIFGLAVPGLAASMRPAIGIVIFIFVAVNVMRSDVPTLRRMASKPWRFGLAFTVNVCVPACLVGGAVTLIGRTAIEPGLLLGLALAAAAPPLVAAPAYALLLGFSNALPLAVLVFGMAVSPIVSPLVADFIAGAAVPIDRWLLAGHLALFLGVAGLVGIAARLCLGWETIERRRSELDGLGVVLFFIFAIALTDGIIDVTIERPLFVLAILALAFGLAGASFLVTFILWRRFEEREAMTLALATGLRNMGLLIAVIGASTVPSTTFIFFALSQFPIYFAPQLLKPMARRLGRSADAAGLPTSAEGDRRGARL